MIIYVIFGGSLDPRFGTADWGILAGEGVRRGNRGEGARGNKKMTRLYRRKRDLQVVSERWF